MVYILILLAVLVAGFLIAVAMQPSEFRVTRGLLMAAPSSVIFQQVNNLHHWQGWSPWIALDPQAKTTFEGPLEGTGAITRWNGNNKVGKGSMTIVEIQQDIFIKFRLDFLKPMTATNTAEFRFQPEINQTLVTWTMYGPNTFMGKAIGLIMNCNKMVGRQFEQGLNNLKKIVEAK